MNSPADDIMTILTAVPALGLTAATNMFVGHMPEDKTSLVVCVFDTGGYDPANIMSGSGVSRPTVEIMVRGIPGEYEDAYAKAAAIDAQLHLLTGTTVDTARYLIISRIGDINSIGVDKGRQPLLTINYRMERTAS